MDEVNLPAPAAESAAQEPAAKKWRPLPALERRVLGVLLEKAKTTPEQYPMTLNGICTGCNQKSNRYPQMDIDTDDLEPVLDRLKAVGAVAEIQGTGRVSKYRHFFYDWLAVNKVEAAVMAELLLRGAQTEGELRGRASRMETIADLTALRQILDGLKARGLVISLTPAGRGHVITHGLYEPRELDKLRSEAGRLAAAAGDDEPEPAPRTQPSTSASASRPSGANVAATMPAASTKPATLGGVPASGGSDLLQQEVRQLRAEMTQLRTEIDELTAELSKATDDLRMLKDSLGG